MTATTSKVLVKEVKEAEGTLKGFQSDEALQAAKAKVFVEEEEVPKDKLESAVVAGPPVPRGGTGMDRMVRVRAREFIPPFRFGPQMYSLKKGKECLVPVAVKLHLEEKGLL